MKPYTKQYLDFQRRKYCRCGENAIVLVAFNSNARWGGTYSAGAYGTFTAALAGKKLVSAYQPSHPPYGPYRAERHPTFYIYRKGERPYHMNFCFCAGGRIRSLEVGVHGDWSPYSDHVPLVLEADIADLRR